MMKKLLILTVVFSAIGFSQIRYNYGTFRDSVTVNKIHGDSLDLTGYAQVNNIEAKSGDMVAIRDTTRTSSTMGIGSITGTIDSALTVFSGADYGGIHARGGLFSGALTTGLINGQTISSAANFTGDVDIAGSAPFYVEALGVTGEILIDYSTTAGPSNGLRVELEHPTGAASGSPQLRGVFSKVSNYNTSGTFSSLTGVLSNLEIGFGGGATTSAFGVDVLLSQDGTTGSAYGFYLSNPSVVGTLTNLYQVYLGSPSVSGTLTNNYGIFQESGSGANSFGGSSNTFTNTVTLSSLTASRLTATDASKNLVSTITLANLASSVSDVTGTTGTGKFVLDTSPTLVTPNIGAATGTSVNLTGAGTFGGNLLVNPTNTNTTDFGASPGIILRNLSSTNNNYTVFQNQSALNIISSGILFRTTVQASNYGEIKMGVRGASGFIVPFHLNSSGLTTLTALSVTGAGTFGGNIAVNGGDFTTTQSRFTFNKGITASDTIRSGDFTTYSYFIPGGALVQSSTESIKKNIRDYTADLSKFSLVKPKRYNFKEEAFLKLFDESTIPDSLSEKEKGDIRKQFREDNLKEAQEKSKREMAGFLAEEFNSILGKDSKEINQQDVINVMWLKIQELEARIKRLE